MFKVGDFVVCIRDDWDLREWSEDALAIIPRPIKGNVYIVSKVGLLTDPWAGEEGIWIKEIELVENKTKKLTYDIRWQGVMFRKVQKATSIESLRELLKTPVKELA